MRIRFSFILFDLTQTQFCILETKMVFRTLYFTSCHHIMHCRVSAHHYIWSSTTLFLFPSCSWSLIHFVGIKYFWVSLFPDDIFQTFPLYIDFFNTEILLILIILWIFQFKETDCIWNLQLWPLTCFQILLVFFNVMSQLSSWLPKVVEFMVFALRTVRISSKFFVIIRYMRGSSFLDGLTITDLLIQSCNLGIDVIFPGTILLE